MLSWWKSLGNGFDSYATSRNTPEAIQKMRDEGYILMSERVSNMISKELAR